MQKGIVAGLPITKYYPEYKDAYLFCVTETTSKELLDELINEVRA